MTPERAGFARDAPSLTLFFSSSPLFSQVKCTAFQSQDFGFEAPVYLLWILLFILLRVDMIPSLVLFAKERCCRYDSPTLFHTPPLCELRRSFSPLMSCVRVVRTPQSPFVFPGSFFFTPHLVLLLHADHMCCFPFLSLTTILYFAYLLLFPW